MLTLLFLLLSFSILNANSNKKIAYIVSDTTIPYWNIMSHGIKNSAETLGYEVEVYNSLNDSKTELENTIKAINENVSGIIVSPNNSSSCSTILKLAKKANIPVIISDIGADSGEYISYISSDNKKGAYDIGITLAEKISILKIPNPKVAIISIPQKRLNGQERTAGFVKAMEESTIKNTNLKQQITFSKEETYNFTKELLKETPDLNAIWLQGSDKYQGALDAIYESGKKDKVLLLTFDAEPEFVELIENDTLLASAMQQPFLMGEKAVVLFDKYFKNEKIEKNYKLPVLAISKENIKDNLALIKRNVFGIDSETNKKIQ
ncbi:sugar ABC transporter substrate-binding protein [Arcobacter caeni]|uniref:Sugar ABC transporter substrate-binding protein n=1 Tax=Arcobacter caeni TaxID=1912877 RepID=A0A363CZW5_9BACT|nr:sugar ABC transporter substrate-binding protein [Arcobacter caeni]